MPQARTQNKSVTEAAEMISKANILGEELAKIDSEMAALQIKRQAKLEELNRLEQVKDEVFSGLSGRAAVEFGIRVGQELGRAPK